jgi:hypothetical protein
MESENPVEHCHTVLDDWKLQTGYTRSIGNVIHPWMKKIVSAYVVIPGHRCAVALGPLMNRLRPQEQHLMKPQKKKKDNEGKDEKGRRA